MSRLPFGVVSVLLAVCWCVLMVSAKNVETSVRVKRTTADTCENVEQFFKSRNISLSSGKSKGGVCGGHCCNDQVEDLLRKQGQKDFAALLRHNSRSLQGLLSFTGATLTNQVSDWAEQSENKTLVLFLQVYKNMAVLTREPTRRLFSDVRNFVQVNWTKTDLAASSIDIKASVASFFTNFFPLVYHHILHINGSSDFDSDYKECLRKSAESILPFGDIPKMITQSLSRSLETTRMLLQAFAIGNEVLNTTDTLLVDESGKSNAECHQALLKMNYCPKCKGLIKHTKPCLGYCLNVLRGCLTKYVAELDSPWNGYVEGVESLINAMKKSREDAGPSPDIMIRTLDVHISEAIMYAMQKMKEIDAKVQRICGRPTFLSWNDPMKMEVSTPLPATSKPRFANQEVQLLHLLTSISKTRGFYGNLADTLCHDESFVEQKDQGCWNGERIAEYSKVVVDVGFSNQKYNPEVKPMTNLQSIDPRVADLVEKLRHVHHMAMTSARSSGVDMDYMQRDGFEGSGSGHGPYDDSEDEYNPTGSGSGHGAIPSEEDGRSTQYGGSKGSDTRRPPATPKTGDSSIAQSSVVLTVLLAYLASIY